MQFANGGDLRNYLKDNFKELTWEDKKRLAFQIADGLNYLHNENVLHRDLVSIYNSITDYQTFTVYGED
jgi:serine/threonine protein kinase